MQAARSSVALTFQSHPCRVGWGHGTSQGVPREPQGLGGVGGSVAESGELRGMGAKGKKGGRGMHQWPKAVNGVSPLPTVRTGGTYVCRTKGQSGPTTAMKVSER